MNLSVSILKLTLDNSGLVLFNEPHDLDAKAWHLGRS